MKKIFILLLFVALAIGYYHYNFKTNFFSDNTFAMTIDGEEASYIPHNSDTKKYSVNIDCKNAKAKWNSEEWKLAISEITSKVSCNLEFSSEILYLSDKVLSATDNSGIYSDTEANNYVWFNNELWRVLKIDDVYADSSTETTKLPKIIRANPLEKLLYDSSSNKNYKWDYDAKMASKYTSTPTLYIILNHYYLGKDNATDAKHPDNNSLLCYAVKKNSIIDSLDVTTRRSCDFSNIGIDPNDYYGQMIKEVYWNLDQNTLSTQKSYVGLPYENEILNSAWAKNGMSEWTLTPGSNKQMKEIKYENDGSITSNSTSLSNSNFVRPVVYLKESVYVVSGDGTESDPYQIAM